MSEVHNLIEEFGVEVEKKKIKQVHTNNEYNQVIMEYYRKLSNRNPLEERKIERKMEAMDFCNKIWVLDSYEASKVLDFKKTSLCKDKFCNNCKKVKQASRMAKFVPALKPHSEKLYQLTLTVPNVKGEDLSDTIKKMFKSFGMLVRYLNGTKKIKNVDFEAFGFKGAIRSLEVTFKNNDYHPHIHAAVVLDMEREELKHTNSYSYDYARDKNGKKVKGKKVLNRLFSDREILIQKIWKLLNKSETVTKEAIDSLDIGYSCRLDKFYESDFVELFKYMTKATTEEETTFTYKQFETLYFALKSVRQIQGYGCFFNVKDEGVEVEDVVETYNIIIDLLKQKEEPQTVLEEPSKLMDDDDRIVISRKNIYKYIKKYDVLAKSKSK
ncbi:TPA: protein rep [Bacillus nitratireducens]